MNLTVIWTLSKLALETGRVTLLPFAVFRVRNSPYIYGLNPFEIMPWVSHPMVQWVLPMEDKNLDPNYLTIL